MNNLITGKKKPDIENAPGDNKQKLKLKKPSMVEEMFSANQEEGNSSV